MKRKLLILAVILLFPMSAFALEEISDERLDEITSYGFDPSVLLEEGMNQSALKDRVAAYNLMECRNLVAAAPDNIIDRYHAAMAILSGTGAECDGLVPSVMISKVNDIGKLAITPYDWQVDVVSPVTFEVPAAVVSPSMPVNSAVNGFSYSGNVAIVH